MNQQVQLQQPQFEVADLGPANESLAPGTELLGGQYTIERYLSSGGFGITYLARDSLDRRVVIKECYPEALCSRTNKSVRARSTAHVGEFQSLVSMFVREARSIAKLKHPNIVGVHQVFEDNQTAYMALDLIEGQDLQCLIEEGRDDFTPERIQKLLITLLHAIAMVHDQDMLHRDISPDNVLLDKWGNPILIDFGAAREQASKKSRAISALLVVKDGYSPQEFYISGGRQGPSSDLYSLAATFVHLITGFAPTNSQNRLAALATNKPDPYQPLAGQFPGYGPDFLECIDQAMSVFPADRIQSAHEWLERVDPEMRKRAAKARAQDEADIKDIVSQLVTQTASDIVAMSPEERRKTQMIAPPPPKKDNVWAHLSLEFEDDHDDDALGFTDDNDANATWWRADQVAAQNRHYHRTQRWRRVKRRLGATLLMAALLFNVIENPDDNIATAAAPLVQKAYLSGLDWTAQTTNSLLTSL